MKKGLILLQSLLLSGVSSVSLFAASNQESIKQTIPVVETVDLTNIESEYLLAIDMPNIFQTLVDFKEAGKSVADLSFNLTNPNGDTFDWTEAYPDDVEMLNYVLDNDKVELHRVTFYASVQAPYINYIIVYYFDPDQSDPESADGIGRFNWQDMDKEQWQLFWTKDVKLTYNMELNN